MDNPNHYNLLYLSKQFDKQVDKFNTNIDKLLYVKLSETNYQNELTNEIIQFINPTNSIYNNVYASSELKNKFKCTLTIKFDFNNEISEPNIKLLQFLPKKTWLNNQVNELFPKLYTTIIQFYKQQIITLQEYDDLKKLKEQIKIIKNFLLDKYLLNPNDLATELYNYYYLNLDKFIKINCDSDYNHDPNIFQYKKFYSYLCVKYKIDQNNFELDYLQNYFTNVMYLKQNYRVVLPWMINNYNNNGDNNGGGGLIIQFENSESTYQIKSYPSRYVNSYQQKYIINITGQNPNKIRYDQFDADRNLDKYFTNIIEFICETIELVYKKD